MAWINETFDFLTHALVFGAYVAIISGSIQSIPRIGNWYKRMSAHAIGIAATGWTLFYGYLLGEDFGIWSTTDRAAIAAASRGLHIVTAGAFLVCLFMIARSIQKARIEFDTAVDEAVVEAIEQLKVERGTDVD